MGIRWREIAGSNLYEGGIVTANGALTGKSTTLIAGAARTDGLLSLVGEAGLQTRRGGDADASGLSYQVRADDGSTNSYVTSIVRHISPNYVALCKAGMRLVGIPAGQPREPYLPPEGREIAQLEELLDAVTRTYQSSPLCPAGR